MANRAWNRAPLEVKRRYFELIRGGASGTAASRRVGVSFSCGSLWFIDAGSVTFIDKPINSRYLTQDDRIEIADGLAAGEPVKSIAVRVGKSYQTVYREIARNGKPDGRYQPWHAHGQAHVRRRRPRPRRVSIDEQLCAAIAGKLSLHWSPAQISRWLRRRWPDRTDWHLCHETIYDAVYRGLIVAPSQQTLRTGRCYRHKRGRGRNREGALKQCTNLKSIHIRPAIADARTQVGHWEGDLLVGAFHRSAVATLVDRKTRHTLLVAIRGGYSAKNVADALLEVFSQRYAERLPGTKATRCSNTSGSRPTPGCGSTSQTPTHHGNAPPTRTPTACYASTSPKAPTSTKSPTSVYETSQTSSTTDHEHASKTAHQPN